VDWSGVTGAGANGSGRKGGILRDGIVGVDGRTGSTCAGSGGNASKIGGPRGLRDGVPGIGDGGGCGNGCVGGGGAGRMPICREEGCGDERTGVPGACEAENDAVRGVMGDGV
jgi:hypothetical protein